MGGGLGDLPLHSGEMLVANGLQYTPERVSENRSADRLHGDIHLRTLTLIDFRDDSCVVR